MVNCTKRVFGYLKSTKNYSLQFNIKEKSNDILEFYSDADFAGSKVDRKSRSGWIGKIYGFSFLWNTRKQTSVSVSTPEAEYIALHDAVRDLQWIRTYLAELGLKLDKPSNVYCDNTCSGSWANSDHGMNRAKHVDIKNHYVKDIVAIGQATIKYVKSDDNEADGFTKPLQRIKFQTFRDSIGVKHCK